MKYFPKLKINCSVMNIFENWNFDIYGYSWRWEFFRKLQFMSRRKGLFKRLIVECWDKMEFTREDRKYRKHQSSISQSLRNAHNQFTTTTFSSIGSLTIFFFAPFAKAITLDFWHEQRRKRKKKSRTRLWCT